MHSPAAPWVGYCVRTRNFASKAGAQRREGSMLVIVSLAPMEGLTGRTFRVVHARCFGKLDRYYTPFLAPPRTGSSFGQRALKELDPALNQGLDVVP